MRKIFVVWMAMVMSVVFSANFSFAGDATADGDNGIAIGMDNTNNNTNTANSNSTSSSNATGGNATATGGNSTAVLHYSNQRELITAPGGYHTDLINGLDTRQHRWVSHGSISVRMRINQSSFTAMTGFLIKAHDMDSRTRDWEDLRDDLVIQPRIDNPKNPLGDADFVEVVSAESIDFASLTIEELVGAVSIRDRKVVENPVDKMYMVYGVYPYAKLAGATVIVKVDDYFREKMKSSTWGGGIGGAISALLSCLTGGAGSINAGYSSGNAMAYMAGGELYLLLHPCPKPVLPPPAPPEVKKPCPPKPCEPPCDLTKIWERIHELEREVQKCTRYCFNNLKLRYALEKEYIELYVCTKETRYLGLAIYHAEVAERNYRKGYDIAAHRAEADQVISEVWYLQAGAINLTRGVVKADEFAASKKLERYPKNFAR